MIGDLEGGEEEREKRDGVSIIKIVTILMPILFTAFILHKF